MARISKPMWLTSTTVKDIGVAAGVLFGGLGLLIGFLQFNYEHGVEVSETQRLSAVEAYDDVLESAPAYVAARESFGEGSAEANAAYGIYSGAYFKALNYASSTSDRIEIFQALNRLSGSIGEGADFEEIRSPLLSVVVAVCEVHNSNGECKNVHSE
jgi:hypothetical protein